MSEAKWTSESVDNNQLWIEAEAIVVGKFGIQPVYKTLQSIRDRTIATERAVSRITDATLTGDLEMARDRIRELEGQLAFQRNELIEKQKYILQLERNGSNLEQQLATLQADLDAAVHVAATGTGFSARYVDRRYKAGRNTGSVEGYERGYQAGLAKGRAHVDELATLQAATPVGGGEGVVWEPIVNGAKAWETHSISIEVAGGGLVIRRGKDRNFIALPGHIRLCRKRPPAQG